MKSLNEEKSRWMKEEMIRIEVDGQPVEGKVSWVPTDFSVEILKPYSGLKKSGNHIPTFMAPYRNYMQEEFRTERAKEILAGLYKTAGSIDKNQKRLSKQLKKVRQACRQPAEDDVDRETFLAERRALRNRFKAGELSQKEYQQKLGTLKANHEVWHRGNRERLERFLKRIPRGNSTEGVIEKIESRDNERKEED